MTSDPNDVDAWLDEFAPALDVPRPSAAAADGSSGDQFLDAIRSEPAGDLLPDRMFTGAAENPANAFAALVDPAEPPTVLAPDPGRAHTLTPRAVLSSTPSASSAASVVAPEEPAPSDVAAATPQEATDTAASAATVGAIDLQPAMEPVDTFEFGKPAEGDHPWSEDAFERATGLHDDPRDDGDGMDFGDDKKKSRRFGFLFEWVPILIGAAIVAALVRTFVFQAFYIPSGSMMPTLNKDDRVLVNKLSYDFNDVGWGDLIVFKRPPDTPGDVPDLIKRVMALPGDRIELFNGDVYVNNIRVQETYLLQQGVSTRLRGDAIPGCIDGTPEACTIPDGFVFVMGDNRGGSTDSRQFGPIPIEDVVGRAVVRVWPLSDITLF